MCVTATDGEESTVVDGVGVDDVDELSGVAVESDSVGLPPHDAATTPTVSPARAMEVRRSLIRV